MKYLIPLTTILLAFFQSCTHAPVHPETNSVYYWKTVFNPDSSELSLINRHNIGRIYMRMFDVVEDDANEIENRTVPNATLKIGHYQGKIIKDSLSDVEFVPVVYITIDALRRMKGHEGVLASNIVKRIRNMCEYNELPNVRELQLDCDWTVSTESSFFSLCDSVRHKITDLNLPWRLSSTIRLHQLSRKTPPVDGGVLMVYNTGNFNDPDADNSIIDPSDVKPYLKHLAGYPLHLDVAYPTYSWQLLFHRRQFVGLINGINLSDTAKFDRTGQNQYTAKRDIPYNNRIIRTGDIIRQELSSFSNIEDVKKQIEERLAGRLHSNILYHLDSNNLSKYSDDEIAQILDAAC